MGLENRAVSGAKRSLILAFSASSAVGVGLAASGCPSSTTTLPYAPITAIEIVSSSLVAGYGCGTADSQVFKYLAIVSQPGDPVCNVFDCFAPQGVFENLLPDAGLQPDGALPTVTLKIFAYNARSYAMQQGTLQGPAIIDGGLCPALADGGGAPGAQWTTTCTATPVQGIPVLAVCPPLEPVAPADAGADAPEAAPEASPEAAPEAAPAAAPEAGLEASTNSGGG
jgi:hypothetical protein